MARIVRVIEYLGTEKQLEAWLGNSCADGVSPMFGPPQQMTVWTVESDVSAVPAIAGTERSGTGAADQTSLAGRGRPLARYEDYNNAQAWKEELEALQTTLMDRIEFNEMAGQDEEQTVALQRVLDRVRQVLAENRGRT